MDESYTRIIRFNFETNGKNVYKHYLQRNRNIAFILLLHIYFILAILIPSFTNESSILSNDTSIKIHKQFTRDEIETLRI